MSALLDKKADFTMNLLLDAASELVQTMEVGEVSFKKVAEQAEISQRTMFRYFRTRELFLDALTEKLYRELDLPDVPEDVNLLPIYIEQLYKKLDAQPQKVMVLLSGDLFTRVLKTAAKQRFLALKKLLSKAYPAANDELITKTAANLRYVMSASSWRYYRMHFEFDLDASIDCAKMLITQALRYLNEKSA
ncbi:MAG: AcrR family transcriptional regulator [Glaciecola sp.]|jgi:AcrR family transcriptional regulator